MDGIMGINSFKKINNLIKEHKLEGIVLMLFGMTLMAFAIWGQA
jgi:hypothetical protein